MSAIVSFIPGRIRLRHGVLREPQCLDRLAAAVARWRHVHAVTGNARVGSLLVQYDAAALDDGCCAARLPVAVGKLPGANAKENAKVWGIAPSRSVNDGCLVPGHWEGDLIKGARNPSQIGTLVERKTLYTVRVQLDCATVRRVLPKGSDLSVHTQEPLVAIAVHRHAKPRKSLGWKSPAELFPPEGSFDFPAYGA